jgi:hypothetical protein
MSKLETNTIDTISGSTTLTLGGTNANAITIPAGVTLSGNSLALAGNIGLGGATPTTSGTGITFPATASASTDANTLDDYEEGTWTPVDISGASLAFTSNEGTYTKIGRIVIANFIFRYPSNADATAAYVGGLPFTVASGNDNFQGNISTTDYASSDIVIWTTWTPSNGLRIRNYNDSGLSNANLSGKYIGGQTIYRI